MSRISFVSGQEFKGVRAEPSFSFWLLLKDLKGQSNSTGREGSQRAYVKYMSLD